MAKKGSCPSGKIRRKSYTRKAYTRADGTRVPASRVPSTCIKDRGSKGKGPKTLPKPSKDASLSKYGYRVHKKASTRRRSLKRASKRYGTLPVLRRLNLITNYTADEENKKKMRSDVEFMKKTYAAEKKRKASRSRHRTKRRGSKGRKL